MTTISHSLMRFRSLILSTLLVLCLLFPTSQVWAKRPPETRNQEKIQISQDMHGRDLSGYEFIKVDLRGIDLSETDLTGAVFNNSLLEGTNLRSAQMKDVLAYSTDFNGADLRDANLTNALLMESSFTDASIEGADFTDAIVNRIQLKKLCSIAEGSNPSTGVSTSYSLGC